ncbi:MAG: pirin family protein [Myxococcota bacterium]
MLKLRPRGERGHADHGWLDTHHTFSFADYHDPAQMGFRALRVINEDRVAPGRGFGAHSHRDMEIVSYVLEGALQHKDSLGTGSVIRPGDVQRMSAGTGVMHSEFNGSPKEPVHFLQIWLIPAQSGIAPSYEQKHFSEADKEGRLVLVASPDARAGSVTIHTDATLWATRLRPGAEVEHRLEKGRHAWVQAVRGSLELGGHTLVAGDGAAISEQELVRLKGTGTEVAEALLFDLA